MGQWNAGGGNREVEPDTLMKRLLETGYPFQMRMAGEYAALLREIYGNIVYIPHDTAVILLREI